MYIIIAGGRDFFDPELVVSSMQELYPFPDGIQVVSGACRGADKLGEWWAKKYTWLEPIVFEADWYPNGKLDKSAGPRRNEKMGNIGDELVTFWDGHSPGSMNMIKIMQDLGKPVHIISYESSDDMLKRILR